MEGINNYFHGKAWSFFCLEKCSIFWNYFLQGRFTLKKNAYASPLNNSLQVCLYNFTISFLSLIWLRQLATSKGFKSLIRLSCPHSYYSGYLIDGLQGLDNDTCTYALAIAVSVSPSASGDFRGQSGQFKLSPILWFISRTGIWHGPIRAISWTFSTW